MTEARRRALLFTVLLIGGVVQVAIGSRLSVWHIAPNIALTSLACASLYVDSGAASAFGFATGLMEAAYAAQLAGTLIVTRTVTGFLVGLLEDRVFRDSIPLAVVTVVLATFVAHTLFYLFAPQSSAADWFARTAGTALYNGVISVPIYATIRKLVGRPRIA